MEIEPGADTLRKMALPHRRAVLRALLWATVLSGIIFGLINLSRGLVLAYLLEFGMAGFSAYMLFAVRRTRHLERWILAYVFPFFIVMMLLLALMPGDTVTLFVWVLLIPLVAHLLLGRRLGLLVSAFFMLVAAAIFWQKNQLDPDLMNIRAISNIVILSLCILFFTHVYEISRERTEIGLLQAARTDFLTQMANLAGLVEFFRVERLRAIRQKQPLSMLLLDLDHFKRVNDAYGHDAGDRALKFVAQLVNSRLRATDLLGRSGGEEFVVLLVNTAGPSAVQVAEDLRYTLEHSMFEYKGQVIPLSMSIGVSELGADGEQFQDLFAASDKRLYEAKAAGRNRVVYKSSAPGIAAGAPSADGFPEAADSVRAARPVIAHRTLTRGLPD
tara:strand:- start:92965 stop:94125 length:1161 start_codon:yes stop_codon:yes gene_type:complete